MNSLPLKLRCDDWLIKSDLVKGRQEPGMRYWLTVLRGQPSAFWKRGAEDKGSDRLPKIIPFHSLLWGYGRQDCNNANWKEFGIGANSDLL